MRELDLFMSLSGGTVVIEAAAGTGKTYSIAALFLRLVVEKEIPVDAILVVTFTEAATEELRDRIRERLCRAVEAFSGEEPADEFLAGLVHRSPDRLKALQLLALALASFDAAAIHTIHGFCSRVLQEHAFECGSLFDAELLADQSRLIREIAEDAWRRHFYPADESFIAYAVRAGCSIDSICRLLQQVVSRFSLEVLPDVAPVDPAPQKEQCLRAFAALQGGWPRARERVLELLTAPDLLSQSSYRRSSIPGWIEEVDGFLKQDDPLAYPEKLHKFTVSSLTAATRKGKDAPEDPFFASCERFLETATGLEDAYHTNLLAIRSGVAAQAREELARRKEQGSLRSYDDLLGMLYDALNGTGGELLKERVRSRFHAGLIDEFQDTDPVQYRIFSGIFSKSDATLVFIGDPKQAIYSFRGADLNAYLAAVRGREAESSFTLLRNWRSTPELLKAFNAMFSGELPFLLPEIEYREVIPGRYRDGEGLFPGQPPFVVRTYNSGNDKPLAKGKGERLVAVDVAREVASLLAAGIRGEAIISGKPLSAGDIAVLVRKNHQGRMVQAALAELGIPSVMHGTESLFRSREVLELHRLLVALLDPGDGRRFRGALVTDMLGRSPVALAGMAADAPEWTDLLERFRSYGDKWLNHGFMVMAMELLAAEGVRPRLLAFPDGERRLTNLLHAVELLHHAELERELGPEGLISWLAEHITEAPDVDEYQLRLETDESCIQLVTIHRSKGLEYPVVFCPFAWEGARRETAPVFHRGDQLFLDIGSDELDDNLRKAGEEQFAEDLRLLYVALTRAKYRCYLAWGRFRSSGSSALAYLLHRPPLDGACDPVAATDRFMAELDDNQEAEVLQRLVALAQGAIRVETAAETPAPVVGQAALDTAPLSARSFRGSIETGWRVTSFTGLTSSRHHAIELPDRDAGRSAGAGLSAAEPPPAGSIFEFPAGAQAGTCLHAILERVDFSALARHELLPLVSEQLSLHRFPADWTDTVAAMIADTVAAPLAIGSETVTLSQLLPASWRPEMEFMLPLDSIGPESLAAVFRRHGDMARFPEQLADLGFSTVKGMLRGFIDLVFRVDGRYYLIDWKSNHLGNRWSDYAPGLLADAMDREFYTLQYHLYTVALHRFLSVRVPDYDYERHFGGVFYLFLRGIHKDFPGTGVFAARPSPGLVFELAGLISSCEACTHDN
ncbi:recBCD enzyme subunit RecB [Geobacter sp. OR-1]|uniref:exodeoxyribonuclease V subunit beta n=1 Tax=Geobacter sp. OR-1 TaxID=1266765 RepID=UPI00054379FA|nr:exodeoxyribonuclease V subunit beta [Geobacter sp. OR-1]GAM07773.1 recBCD enzyme subunit RecB [Geobacter sp. OR-1]